MKKDKKVLIVDDDRDFIRSLEELLNCEGYDTLVAHNGKEALTQAEKGNPDAIILDVMMDSNTEGFQVSRMLSQHPSFKNLPIILVTGISREMNLPFRFEPDKDFLPVAAVIDKPVEPRELLEKLRQIWAESPQKQPINKEIL